MKVWIPHKAGLAYLSDVPVHVEVEVADDPLALPSDPTGVEFLVPTFPNQPPLQELVPLLPDLRVLQLPSAGSDGWTGLAGEHVTICDARGVHDASTAEWVLTAILTHLREFPAFAPSQRAGEWSPRWSRELHGKRVLLIGTGSIGSAVARRLEPFGAELTKVARVARPAEGVRGVEEVPALLSRAEVVILLVPLTAQTRGMVDRDFLAALGDGTLLVNAARGPVVDTAALVSELASGRLGAALDVTDPEPLPPGHPLWREPGALITPHVAALTDGMLARVYTLVAEQVNRYLAGKPLRNQVSRVSRIGS